MDRGHKQRQKQRHSAERHARVALLAERLLPLVTDPVAGLCGSESDERVDWSAVHPSVDPVASGQVSVERGQRKRAQIESFRVVLDTLVGEEALRIVDFCCGSGNFGLALAALLPSCSFVLLDRNSHAIDLVWQRAIEAGLSNVTALVENAEDFTGDFDVAIAMHACGPHVTSGQPSWHQCDPPSRAGPAHTERRRFKPIGAATPATTRRPRRSAAAQLMSWRRAAWAS